MVYDLVWAEDARLAGMQLTIREVLRGRRVLVADAANSFNPYALTWVIHRRRLDRRLLSRVLISRAFTCHQLEALVKERLEPVARQHAADLVIVAGAGALLYDGDVPPLEAARVSLSIVRSLRLSRRTVVTMDAPAAGREEIFEIFRRGAAGVWRATETDGAIELVPEKTTRVLWRGVHGTHGADVQPGFALGDGSARQVPPGAAPR